MSRGHSKGTMKRHGPFEATVSRPITRGHHGNTYVLLTISGRDVGYHKCRKYRVNAWPLP